MENKFKRDKRSNGLVNTDNEQFRIAKLKKQSIQERKEQAILLKQLELRTIQMEKRIVCLERCINDIIERNTNGTRTN